MKSKILEFSLSEISFILLFFLLIIITNSSKNLSSNYDIHTIRDSLNTCLNKIDSLNLELNKLSKLKSRLWPSSKKFLFSVKIVGFNKFMIDDALYSIKDIKYKYNSEIKRSLKEEFVYKIRYTFDPSLSSKDYDNSRKLLRQYFRLF